MKFQRDILGQAHETALEDAFLFVISLKGIQLDVCMFFN